jgi:beta-lactamase regulating signal transducer with metallopeptidase domain
MAVLWLCFVLANYLFSFSSRVKYLVSTGSIIFGFAWFISTLLRFYLNNSAVFDGLSAYFTIVPDHLSVLNYVSVAYLIVLIIPAYKLYQNWRFLKVLRSQQLQKPDIAFRLFVQKTAQHLGIKRRISIFVSALVESPVTIGYLKPIILLPIASANHLSTQQVEAILLHELIHIRRYDYILNLVISTIHTLLYFNPFVQLFSWVAEEERENCCDLAVLQFGYDKISYASALLNLEKLSYKSPIFALRAIGRRNFRSRIEKIVGLRHTSTIRFNYLGSLTAALVLIFGLNLLAIKTGKDKTVNLTFNNWVNPFYFFHEEEAKKTPLLKSTRNSVAIGKAKDADVHESRPTEEVSVTDDALPLQTPFVIPVSYPLKPNSIDKEIRVEKAVEATKMVLETVQWREIEKTIGDGLTEDEKLQARNEYLQQVQRIDWNGLQINLMAKYDHINWPRLNLDFKALLSVSIQDSVYLPLHLDKLTANMCAESPQIVPIPDSIQMKPLQILLPGDSLIKSGEHKPVRKIKISL